MTRFRVALAAVLVLVAGVVVLTVLRPPMPPSVTGSASQPAPVAERHDAPDFTGIDGWINSAPLSLASLRGHVVLIDFWTFSCVNCVRTLPHLHQLDGAYRGRGLVIVGVHSPEFDFEKDLANVAAAVRRLGVTWPVAIDSQMATWNAYQNQFWPAEYLLDQQGRVAYTHAGEGGYEVTDAAVASLLGVPVAGGTSPTSVASGTTPELYAGSQRGQLADGVSYGPAGSPTTYADAGPPAQQDAIQVTGTWVDQGQYLVAVSAGHVRLRFHADSVYIVAGTAAGPVRADVALDGMPVPAALRGPALAPRSQLAVGRQDLYRVLLNVSGGSHLIELAVPAGFQLYTFTFG